MELTTKPDWQEAETRMRAWWAGDVIDRPVLLVRAPKEGVSRAEWDAIQSAKGVPGDDILDWFTNPERVVARQNRYVNATFWGGEAFPVTFPVATKMVAITAAYAGCPYSIDPVSHTGWAESVIDDWDARDPIAFDAQNKWWQISRALLDASAQQAEGRHYVGLPDLNNPGEVVALLRDTQRLAFDLIDNPDPISPAMEEANQLWYRYWQAANGVVHQHIGGYLYWMGIWSDIASTDLQCDFNALISPQMFETYFLPGIEEQTRWVDRTIFHLDGPTAARHLDSLLSLPRLDGIQWTPGDGKPPTHQWLPLLRRVQAHGKSVVVFCEPYEVEKLIEGLEPERLLMILTCDSEAEAKDLLAKAPTWSRPRYWSTAT